MTRPPLPAPPYRGGCLCGAVRFVYTARPRGLNACHCADCKKLSGADAFLVFMGERAALVQESGDLARWRKRADSGREVDIVRCAACGARLWHEPVSAPEFVFICAGALDDSSWFVPATHIWVEKAGASFSPAPDALLVEGQPPDRAALFAAFERLYPKA